MSKRPLSIHPPPDGTWLRTVLDAMVEAVLVVDSRGRIALTNGALEAMTTGKVRGRRAKNVIKNEPLRIAMRQARKRGQASEVRVEATVHGEQRVFRAQVSPLPKRSGAVAVLHDVTAVEQADRERRDFVANASHELRTPLTAIRGFAETLITGGTEDASTRKRFLEAILRQTLRLQRLAEDLATLARSEAAEQPLELGPVDVVEVTRTVVGDFRFFAAAREVELEVAAPNRRVLASGDVEALTRVLSNLVENAIQASPPRTSVVVTVRSLRRSVQIAVRDRGKGIAAVHHARIFERFYRVDEGRARSDGGSGLGLAIVKHLVERMGGTVSVDSAPGRGATFRVELARARAKPDASARAALAERPATRSESNEATGSRARRPSGRVGP